MAKRRQRRTAGSRERREDEVRSLPALSLLTDLPAWGELTPTSEQLTAFDEAVRRLSDEGVSADELTPACVVRLDRGFPALVWEGGVVRAEFAAQLTKAEYSRVAVGDWVCLRVPKDHQMALIQQILPRTSDIARWKGGSRGERQTLAANVDIVLVVAALGEGGISLDRLARSAVIARDCGAQAAVVLTKADRVTPEQLGEILRGVRTTLTDVPLVVTCPDEVCAEPADPLRSVARSAGASFGPEGVRALVPDASVGIMLGESGAGKSTLLNALLGHEALQTGAVRERDDMGRHTTVARRMVSLEGAGVIVDAPGLRSLPIVGHERGLALVFPEVAQAAASCRFRDCTHTHEPHCAVLELVESSVVARERVDAYVSLAREMRASASSLDPDIVI